MKFANWLALDSVIVKIISIILKKSSQTVERMVSSNVTLNHEKMNRHADKKVKLQLSTEKGEELTFCDSSRSISKC